MDKADIEEYPSEMDTSGKLFVYELYDPISSETVDLFTSVKAAIAYDNRYATEDDEPPLNWTHSTHTPTEDAPDQWYGEDNYGEIVRIIFVREVKG